MKLLFVPIKSSFYVVTALGTKRLIAGPCIYIYIYIYICTLPSKRHKRRLSEHPPNLSIFFLPRQYYPLLSFTNRMPQTHAFHFSVLCPPRTSTPSLPWLQYVSNGPYAGRTRSLFCCLLIDVPWFSEKAERKWWLAFKVPRVVTWSHVFASHVLFLLPISCLAVNEPYGVIMYTGTFIYSRNRFALYINTDFVEIVAPSSIIRKISKNDALQFVLFIPFLQACHCFW
jgi:hypothetical protein